MTCRFSRELAVRAVEKGTVSENLRVCETEAQQRQREMEWGYAFPICDVPPLGQVWTNRKRRSLQGEKHNEKTGVTPEQTRKLRLDGRTSEHKGWDVFSDSASGAGECEEHREDRVYDRRRGLKSVGPLHEEEK